MKLATIAASAFTVAAAAVIGMTGIAHAQSTAPAATGTFPNRPIRTSFAALSNERPTRHRTRPRQWRRTMRPAGSWKRQAGG